MAQVKYCNLCVRNVTATKRFNWTIALIGLLTFGFVTFIYLCYYIAKSGDTCPICKNSKLQSAQPMSKV